MRQSRGFSLRHAPALLLRAGFVWLLAVSISGLPGLPAAITVSQLTENQQSEESPDQQDSSGEEFAEEALLAAPGATRVPAPRGGLLQTVARPNSSTSAPLFQLLHQCGYLAHRNGLGAPLRC